MAPKKIIFDPGSLAPILLNTGVQQSDPRMYQFLNSLIQRLINLGVVINNGSGGSGTTGPQGLKGDKGDPGIPGDSGSSGEDGPPGVAGARGADGAAGAIGPAGSIILPDSPNEPDWVIPIKGDVGNPGPTGAQGPIGLPIFFTAEDGFSENIVGPAGPQGATGNPGGISTLVPPDDSQFSWINQGGASVAVGSNVIYLKDPANGVTSLRIRELALPSAPYTLTAGFIPNIINANFPSCGLCLRDSVSGKVVTFSYGFSTNLDIGLAKFNSPTSFNAAYSGSASPISLVGAYLWLRINDNGTSRISSYSFDGINFRQLQSVANTDFLTPNRIGFYADANNASNDCAVSLVSWSF